MGYLHRCLAFVVSALLTTGCAATPPKPLIIERDGIDAIILSDDHKVSYIKQNGHIDRICASREADAVSTDESGFSLGFSALGKKEQIGEQSGRGELALGGRNPLVLLSREFLYRACELTNNHNSNEKTTIEVYKMFLTTLEKVAQTHLGAGSAPMPAAMPAYDLQNGLIDKKKKTQQNNDEDDEDDGDDGDDGDDE